jgi:FixJ family two-component response regulator
MSNSDRSVCGSTNGHPTVLVVDDELHVLTSISHSLNRLGWQCICAFGTADALKASRHPNVSLALVDYRLGTTCDGLRLGHAIRSRRGIPFVLVSGFLSTALVVQAMKAGATDVIDKPVSEARLKELVESVIHPQSRAASSVESGSRILASDDVSPERRPVMARWARMTLGACSASGDLRTIAMWAKHIGMSQGSIEEICRICGVKALASRDLARVLRALAISRSTGTAWSSHLECADERTLRRLCEKAGIGSQSREVPLSGFFAGQTFVPTSRLCVRELAHLAANSPYFFVDLTLGSR